MDLTTAVSSVLLYMPDILRKMFGSGNGRGAEMGMNNAASQWSGREVEAEEVEGGVLLQGQYDQISTHCYALPTTTPPPLSNSSRLIMTE